MCSSYILRWQSSSFGVIKYNEIRKEMLPAGKIYAGEVTR